MYSRAVSCALTSKLSLRRSLSTQPERMHLLVQNDKRARKKKLKIKIKKRLEGMKGINGRDGRAFALI